jgi:iron complex outermembrane receptor protein
LAFLIADPAVAQDLGQASAASTTEGGADARRPVSSEGGIPPGTRLDDIVVIGRKRDHAEELQQVPIAITALGPIQLQRSTVRDMVDVGRLTPNASLQSSAQKGVQNFSIRGMGVSGSSPSDEPAVGIFQDGVYWGSNYGALNELLDVEGVEVLRGPQGTLFGRNVTGGAVTLRSARPGQQPYRRVTIGVSNGVGVEGSAVVNQPFSDSVSARLAILGRHNDGLFTNKVGGRSSSYGESSVQLVRPSIKIAPSSDFDITFLGEYYRSRGDPIVVRGVSPRTVGAAPNLGELAGYVSARDYAVTQVGDEGYANLDVYFGMVEMNWKIGPGTLTSITGYRNVKAHSLTDDDGFPVAGFLQEVAIRQHQWSQELRYAATLSDWLGITAGGYYFNQKFNFAEARDLNNHLTRVATRSSLKNDSYAFFAEADIKPIAGFTLTVGGRYTHETKTPKTAPFGSCTFSIAGACTYSTASPYKGSNFSPKVGVSYQIDKSKMIYASWTRGFRSGGFSLRGTALASPYQAETVDAYEAGLKTELFDRRVRFNLSGYYNKFHNLQRTVLGVDPVLGVVQSVFNAANAEIKGFEGELVVIPTTGLTLTGNYGYTDAKYLTFLGVANPGSRQFVRVPKHTANIMADFETQVGNGDKVAFHVGGAYTSRYFFDDPNLLSQKGYWLLDANVNYTINQNVTLTLYARNITNTRYSVWGSTLGALGENLFPGDPTTYGARAAVTF